MNKNMSLNITPGGLSTHSSAECHERCYGCADEQTMINAAQVAQDAQAGYACDYQNKRQPMACNEIKECCKGHAVLGKQVARQRVSKIAKRHASRLMSDAYGKGIVRGQVEIASLRVHAREDDVTFAEAPRTSQT